MKTARLLLLALCGLALVTTTRATTVIPPTFDQLVGQAELIFQGTVTGVKSEWIGEGGQRRIVSFVTFKVDDTLKGNPGETYTVRMLGGTVDDTTMEVTDSPKFKVGDRDILFVENNGTQFIPLVGIMHGRFRVQKDPQTGADLIMDNHGHAVSDVAELGKDANAVLTGGGHSQADDASHGPALRSSDFKAAVRAKLGASVK
ncbi:hypothetical protein BH20VER2_BH20VER2_09100 [soil metagenome]|nr:hypothetical protein [Chthoniobacterales bacterium]